MLVSVSISRIWSCSTSLTLRTSTKLKFVGSGCVALRRTGVLRRRLAVCCGENDTKRNASGVNETLLRVDSSQLGFNRMADSILI